MKLNCITSYLPQEKSTGTVNHMLNRHVTSCWSVVTWPWVQILTYMWVNVKDWGLQLLLLLLLLLFQLYRFKDLCPLINISFRLFLPLLNIWIFLCFSKLNVWVHPAYVSSLIHIISFCYLVIAMKVFCTTQYQRWQYLPKGLVIEDRPMKIVMKIVLDRWIYIYIKIYIYYYLFYIYIKTKNQITHLQILLKITVFKEQIHSSVNLYTSLFYSGWLTEIMDFVLLIQNHFSE